MLPPNIRTYLKAQAHLRSQKHNGTVRGGIGHSNRVMRAVTIKHTDEIGPSESMAVSKVLELPK
jgi:hypothetical protein